MVFPESDRIVFERNPITQVICQLRFPPILRIVGEPSGFQEKIRESYPLYRRSDSAGIPPNIAGMLSEAGFQGAVAEPTHQFLSVDEKRQLSITKNFVAASTAEYERWEGFRAEIELAVRSVADEYNPAFFDRVGLRYTDAINREELGLADTSWSDLIRSEFIGAFASPVVSEAVAAFQGLTQFSLADVPDSMVQIQYGIDQSTDTYVFDADYYVTGQLNEQQCFTALDSFNQIAGNLFRWIIQPQLRDALGSTD